MKFHYKITAILLTGLSLSILLNGGLLYLRREAWLPPPVAADPTTTSEEELPENDSLHLQMSQIQDLAEELKEERAALSKESEAVARRAAQIEQEKAEVIRARKDIQTQIELLEKSLVRISQNENRNIRNIARMYAEMTPRGVATLFRQLEDSLTVKIISYMPQDTAGAVLEEMTKMETQDAERAARISDLLRLLSVDEN